MTLAGYGCPLPYDDSDDNSGEGVDGVGTMVAAGRELHHRIVTRWTRRQTGREQQGDDISLPSASLSSLFLLPASALFGFGCMFGKSTFY